MCVSAKCMRIPFFILFVAYVWMHLYAYPWQQGERPFDIKRIKGYLSQRHHKDFYHFIII